MIAVGDAPPLDEMLRRALGRVDDADVRLFYRYFDELKGHVRRYLGRKARKSPGESAVAQSALLSLFCDVTLAQVPLADVDEHGYPALWPLLLKYIERHCNKWNKYYRARKRKAAEVPLAAADSGGPGIDPPDHRGPADDEEAVGAALEALHANLTPRQRRVADLTAGGRTLEEIAQELNCSQSLVSMEKKAIRRLLETA
jgi:DNA-binding CsgD family transcriptional regulator